MHSLYFVAIKKNKEKFDSAELKSRTQSLLESNGFASEGGFWSCAKADWFVIGGRWSGTLQSLKLGKFDSEVRKLLKKNKKDKTISFFTDADIKENAPAIQKLWEKLGGKGINSWERDQYNHEGYDDDAMLLDKKLYEAFKKKKYKETEVAVVLEEGYVEDEMLMKDFLKDKKVVNNYYLIVVDYHM